MFEKELEHLNTVYVALQQLELPATKGNMEKLLGCLNIIATVAESLQGYKIENVEEEVEESEATEVQDEPKGE